MARAGCTRGLGDEVAVTGCWQLLAGEKEQQLWVPGRLYERLQLSTDCKALEVEASRIHLHPGPPQPVTWCFILRRLREKQKLERAAGL